MNEEGISPEKALLRNVFESRIVLIGPGVFCTAASLRTGYKRNVTLAECFGKTSGTRISHANLIEYPSVHDAGIGTK